MAPEARDDQVLHPLSCPLPSTHNHPLRLCSQITKKHASRQPPPTNNRSFRQAARREPRVKRKTKTLGLQRCEELSSGIPRINMRRRGSPGGPSRRRETEKKIVRVIVAAVAVCDRVRPSFDFRAENRYVFRGKSSKYIQDPDRIIAGYHATCSTFFPFGRKGEKARFARSAHYSQNNFHGRCWDFLCRGDQ